MLRNLYILACILVIPVAVGLYSYDLFVNAPRNQQKPIPQLVFILITLAAINGIVIIGFIDYLRKTKKRKEDPYRFAIEQFRYAEIKNIPDTRTLIRELETLDYEIIEKRISEKEFNIVALRKKEKMFQRFPGDQMRPDQRMVINGTLLNSSWNLAISCRPNRKYILGDFSLTTYLSLEELVTSLNLRDYLVKLESGE